MEVGQVVPVLMHKGGDDDVDADGLLVNLLRDGGSRIRRARVLVGISFSWLARFHFVSLQARPALSTPRSCTILLPTVHRRI